VGSHEALPSRGVFRRPNLDRFETRRASPTLRRHEPLTTECSSVA
jgi:hypothetical protein